MKVFSRAVLERAAFSLIIFDFLHYYLIKFRGTFSLNLFRFIQVLLLCVMFILLILENHMSYKNIISVLLLLSLIACAGIFAFSRADYKFELVSVERPKDAQDRYGEPKIDTLNESGKTKYYFEDQLIKISWYIGEENFYFTLNNKTEHSIKIKWDEAAYVNEFGNTKKIMHSGVKFIEKNNPQAPSVVIRGSTVSDIILPTDNVYFVSGEYGGWKKHNLFLNASRDFPRLKEYAENLKGKTVSVLLPLEISGVVNEYLFNFKCIDYTLTDKSK